MKKKELKKSLWEKFFSFVFLLLVFLPARAVADDASDLDINLNWGKDATYEWQANKSRLKIKFKFWDGQYRDDWIHNKKNNGTDGGIRKFCHNRKYHSCSECYKNSKRSQHNTIPVCHTASVTEAYNHVIKNNKQ